MVSPKLDPVRSIYTGRRLDERLVLRAPRLSRRLIKLVLLLPPSSPVRRRALKRMMERGWAALSRGDDEIVLIVFDRDIEFNIIGAEAGLLGLAEHYHGHAGWHRTLARGVGGLADHAHARDAG
jgi:hypothetical protein